MHTLQNIMIKLLHFWIDHGCVFFPAYDLPMGAGTFHPVTVFYSLIPQKYYAVFIQPCRRPADSRGAHNKTNRLQRYFQLQVLLKPAADGHICNAKQHTYQQLYLQSLQNLGLSLIDHDIRFIEDNWNSPTLGAYGMGWEVWCDGIEITQFTYMQQLCGVNCLPVVCEITYGLERLAMKLQQVDNVYDLAYDQYNSYGDFFHTSEKQWNDAILDVKTSQDMFHDIDKEEAYGNKLLTEKLPLVAYDSCLKCSHLFNLLDAGGYISNSARPVYVSRIRGLAEACVKMWLQQIKNE